MGSSSLEVPVAILNQELTVRGRRMVIQTMQKTSMELICSRNVNFLQIEMAITNRQRLREHFTSLILKYLLLIACYTIILHRKRHHSKQLLVSNKIQAFANRSLKQHGKQCLLRTKMNLHRNLRNSHQGKEVNQ